MKSNDNAFTAALKCIIHPVSIISIIVLILNDHFLKAYYPSILTGKLSDFAGLIFFPFLIAFLLSYLQIINNKIKTDFIFITSFIISTLFFILIKTIGTINISFSNFISFILPYDFPITKDSFDLIALLSLIPSILIYLSQRKKDYKKINKKVSFLIVLLASISCIATSYSIDLAYKIYTEKDIIVITENQCRNGSLNLSLPEICYVSKNMGKSWKIKKLNEIDEKLIQQITEDYKDIYEKTPLKSKEITFPGNDNIIYKLIIEKKIVVSYNKGKTWKTAWEYPLTRKKIYTRQHWSNFRGQNKGPYDFVFTPDNSGKLIVTLGEEGIVIKDKNDNWEQFSLGEIDATPYTIYNPLIFLNMIPMEINFFISLLILLVCSINFIFQIIVNYKINKASKIITKKLNIFIIISTFLLISSFIIILYTFSYFIIQEYHHLIKILLSDEDLFSLLAMFLLPAFFHSEILISIFLLIMIIIYIVIIRIIWSKTIKLLHYKIKKTPLSISFYILLILIIPIIPLYLWSAGIIERYYFSLLISVSTFFSACLFLLIFTTLKIYINFKKNIYTK